MKKLLVLILLLTIPLHLCSCSVSDENRINLDKSHDEYQDASNNYETSIEKKPKYEYGTAKEILSREIKDFSNVTVKAHTYESIKIYDYLPDFLKFQSKYYYLYANSQAEEIFNLINARDTEGIISKMSPYVRAAEGEQQLEKEINVLFQYIDEAILDYDEDPYPIDQSSSFSYGECNECSIYAEFYVHTKVQDYMIRIHNCLAEEDEDKIGIERIVVGTKEAEDYHREHIGEDIDDSEEEDDDSSQNVGGVFCFTKTENIEVG